MIADTQATAFSDSDNGSCSISLPEILDPCPPDAEALRRLSDNLGSLFQSPEFEFCADARIAAGAAEFRVHRCVLSARSPFFRELFARRGRTAFELKELLGGFEVGGDAVALVLAYIYGGRVGPLPKGVCMCADEECSHVGCRPLVDFMVEVLYASFTFQISELVSLFKVRFLVLSVEGFLLFTEDGVFGNFDFDFFSVSGLLLFARLRFGCRELLFWPKLAI